IIVRSSVWLGVPSLIERVSVTNVTDVLPEAFCVGSAVSVMMLLSRSSCGLTVQLHFSHTSCPGFTICSMCCESKSHDFLLPPLSTIVLYHMITWGLAVLLCVEGVAMLYYPSISDCEQGLQHAIPHYITTYAPMLLVLIANPVFFSRTVSAASSVLCCYIAKLYYFAWGNGILNPMQAFLNTLAFHGWTGLDVDLNPQRSRELAWDSGSTSVPNTMGQNPVVGTTLLYQSHIQEVQKDTMGNGQQHSDAISVLSEGNWLASGASSSPVYQGW
ncbi:hypothetical protein GOODEAATRI_019056, partial [Goodea atripinnis]